MTSSPDTPVVVSYGGGVNSTAMLVGLHERGERPDVILFADTGGERPETYKYVEKISAWCRSIGLPEIGVVRDTFQGEFESLEDHCLRLKTLPSLAYGFRSCSKRYKREPQDREVKRLHPYGEIIKLIGFDAGEAHRAERVPDRDGRFIFRYPLIEWGWGREECVQAIARAGLPPPGKSSCFFCPASRKSEILALPKELQERAIAMEKNASENFGVIEGLGRHFSWEALIRSDERQLKLFPPDIICDCYDG